MTQLPLDVYRIDMKYIRNLHNIDDRIFSVSPKELEWCNEHISDPANTANVLYQKYVSGEKLLPENNVWILTEWNQNVKNIMRK